MSWEARCGACGHEWPLVPPSRRPVPAETALAMMDAADCPNCGNDASKAPIRWRVAFGWPLETVEARRRA